MKILLKTLKIIGFGIIVLLLSSLVVRFFVQRIEYNSSIKNNTISDRQRIILDDSEQVILIEGKTLDKPVLITMGSHITSPVSFGVGYRNYHDKLLEKFILVQYDKYGTGLNYTEKHINIDYQVELLTDLIEVIKKEFPKSKIYLLGMNENTPITIKTAKKSNLLSGVISYNPFISYNTGKNYTKNELNKLKLSSDDIKQLDTAMQQKNNYDSYSSVISLGYKYIKNYEGKNESNSRYLKDCLRLFFSPDYKLKDLFRIVNHNSKDYYEELLKIDMTNDITSLAIPHTIINGKHHYLTPTNFIKSIDNNNMTVNELPNTGEIIIDEDVKEFYNIINWVVK